MDQISKYFYAFKISHIKEIDQKELKRRFRILAKKYHPDHGGTSAQFRFVNEAYRYLKKLREDFCLKESRKFFTKKYKFYSDGSIYDTRNKRWILYKGKNIKNINDLRIRNGVKFTW